MKGRPVALEVVPSAPTPAGICQVGALTFRRAEEFTGLSRRTLYRLVEEERLHQIHVRGRALLPRRELIELLAEGLEGVPE